MATKIAYKVENGVIVNSTVVDADAPIEEGFVTRDYNLYIGAVESFGDFYPPNTTQEQIDKSREECIKRADSFLVRTEEIVQNLETELNDLTAQLESLPENDESRTDLENVIAMKQNELAKNNKYNAYLNDYKNNLVNPVFQFIKDKEEI